MVQNYGHFTEGVDFAYWWSFSCGGLQSMGLPCLVLFHWPWLCVSEAVCLKGCFHLESKASYELTVWSLSIVFKTCISSDQCQLLKLTLKIIDTNFQLTLLGCWRFLIYIMYITKIFTKICNSGNIAFLLWKKITKTVWNKFNVAKVLNILDFIPL